MSNILVDAIEKNLITVPSYTKTNLCYLTIMGSHAYGVNNPDSDHDYMGIVIPPKDYIFPHLTGRIYGFEDYPSYLDPKKQQFQEVFTNDRGETHDFHVYQIHKYFRLAEGCNPNIIDSLYTPVNCVSSLTQVGQKIRENRHLFLSKKGWPTFKGYAYAQLSQLKKADATGKRYPIIQQYGYDIKHAYHVVRLLDEIEQILMYKSIDLQRNKEQLKSIRRGEWTFEEITSYFSKKESELEGLFHKSDLPSTPDHEAIRNLLIECLEHHYGSLRDEVNPAQRSIEMLRQIRQIIDDGSSVLMS